MWAISSGAVLVVFCVWGLPHVRKMLQDWYNQNNSDKE